MEEETGEKEREFQGDERMEEGEKTEKEKVEANLGIGCSSGNKRSRDKLSLWELKGLRGPSLLENKTDERES